MRSRNGTRVRWDAAERALLVQQSQIVLAERPGDALKDVIAEALLSFPPERRRKVDAKTVTWVRDAVRALPPLPRKPVGKPAAPAEPVNEATTADPVPTASPAIPAQPASALSPLSAALVDSAVEVLVGILSDPRLRLAVRGLLAQPTQAKASEDKGFVVVAGLQPGDAKSVEKTFADMLPVRTWSPDQTREELEQYLGEARLVIGMQDQLTQAIESSLRRLGDRYVQNYGGMQGLHKRLAEEAMR